MDKFWLSVENRVWQKITPNRSHKLCFSVQNTVWNSKPQSQNELLRDYFSIPFETAISKFNTNSKLRSQIFPKFFLTSKPRFKLETVFSKSGRNLFNPILNLISPKIHHKKLASLLLSFF
ncbi:hypothetical protein ACH5RR_039473 [Cinchona calisaya]|uniref:Uncharacterized protein n=1 Tax=Cinchona calisaya TaxID=153742 RepID=A0ABD2Y3I6_9GENT